MLDLVGVAKTCLPSQFDFEVLEPKNCVHYLLKCITWEQVQRLRDYLISFLNESDIGKLNELALQLFSNEETLQIRDSQTFDKDVNILISIEAVRSSLGIVKQMKHVSKSATSYSLGLVLMSIASHLQNPLPRDSTLIEKAVNSWGSTSGMRQELNVLLENKDYLEEHYLYDTPFETWMTSKYGFTVAQERAVFLILHSLLSLPTVHISIIKHFAPTGIPLAIVEKILFNLSFPKKLEADHVNSKSEFFLVFKQQLFMCPLAKVDFYDYVILDPISFMIRFSYSTFNRFREYLLATNHNAGQFIGDLFEKNLLKVSRRLADSECSKFQYTVYSQVKGKKKNLDIVINDQTNKSSLLIEIKSGVISVDSILKYEYDNIELALKKKYFGEDGFGQLMDVLLHNKSEVEFCRRIPVLVVDDTFLLSPLIRMHISEEWRKVHSATSKYDCFVLQVEEFRLLIFASEFVPMGKLIRSYLSNKRPEGYPFGFENFLHKRFPKILEKFGETSRLHLNLSEAAFKEVDTSLMKREVASCRCCSGEVVLDMNSKFQEICQCSNCQQKMSIDEVDNELYNSYSTKLNNHLKKELGYASARDVDGVTI